MTSRRIFLKNGGLALVSLGFAPEFLARTAAAADARRKVLITIFQRGAVDGLNMIVPFGDRAYYKARPSIAIGQPGSGPGAVVDLDGFFGFHPAAGAARAVLPRRHARDRPRLRISRRHAFALRRAGLHGDGNARREEHDRRLAQSLPARARAPGGDAVPRRRRRAAAAALAPGSRAGARHRPDRSVRHPGRPEHRDDAVVVRERICRRGRSRAQHHQPRCVRRDSHAQEHRPGALRAGQRRRLPALRPTVRR